MKVEVPLDEPERLKALYSYEILDTPPERAFDDLSRLASHVCQTPIALLSFVDAGRQWFKSKVGIPADEIPYESPFCGYAVLQQDVFVIPDAFADRRFAESPWIAAAPGIRFYAGAPLMTPEGHAIGTLCVMDYVPRQLKTTEIEALRILARQVMVQLELKRTVHGLQHTLGEREKLERELLESAIRYRDLVENSEDLICTHDLDGVILSVNRAMMRKSGYTEQELVGHNLYAFLSSEARAQFHSYLNVVAKEGRAVGYMRIVTSSGKERILEYDNSLKKDGVDGPIVRGRSVDVTERVLAEQALRQSEERYRNLFESVLDGVYQSTHDGRLLTANPMLVRMLGYESKEELLAVDIRSLYVNPDQRTKLIQKLEEEGELRNAELALLRKDGQQLVVLENARTVRDQAGIILNYEGTLTDITERKKVDQMKDELISVVSHELRTPLTSIQGSLAYLSDRIASIDPEKVRKLVDLASRSSQRMMRLINDMLDVNKIESGKMVFQLKPLELMPLVQYAIDVNQPYADQLGVKLVLDEIHPGARVNADSDRLVQVMTNLLSNAAKFSSPGGIVSVSVSDRGESVRVSVTDRGPGIPESFRSKVFQKFAQADNPVARQQQKGSGLGLSISKAIVERLGGTIGFETKTGAGATFYFELPETASL